MEKRPLVKVKKTDEEVTITIPTEFGLEDGEEYTVIKQDNGVISLVPRDEMRLIDRKKKQHRDQEVIWDHTTLQGKEWDI